MCARGLSVLGRALYFVSALYPENLSALSHKLNLKFRSYVMTHGHDHFLESLQLRSLFFFTLPQTLL